MDTQGQTKKVYLQTFGCQMNEYDSGKILEQLHALSYHRTEDPRQADLILINTCAIREKSEHKVYSLLGSLGRIKLENPGVKIGVGGCVAQQKGEEILKRVKLVDLVFGTDNIFELPDMLARSDNGERVLRTEWHPGNKKIDNFIPVFPGTRGQETPITASIAITKGCNNFCSFCVVPYTRGREVSREPDNIIEEASRLVGWGAKEIMLLGQNVNSYRAGQTRFVDLLQRLNGLEGLERIRYTSPHPKDFNEQLAQAHRDLPKLCEHLHLPFQSGSDRILKAMRRNHRIAEYLEKMEMVRETVPGIALSTDIIVGFPGESDEDFHGTLQVMDAVRFDHIYAFKFSPRSDTPAADFPDQVPERIKADRLARIHELHERTLKEIHRGLVGSRQEVLLEGAHPRESGALIGRTRGHKSTTIPGCSRKPGEIVNVEIVATRKFSLVGREVGRGS
ncbi:MAG: tRNA (N6-isopentenyl adenosine(37)-C2)-methylthiotransferase MiaB [SAR324 cluster bacterium]|nr:tRNA (N6-isopentenyl adenosine(37)-C2)-methylthiotransferase MiaB [SAR324 cluster bacterium]